MNEKLKNSGDVYPGNSSSGISAEGAADTRGSWAESTAQVLLARSALIPERAS